MIFKKILNFLTRSVQDHLGALRCAKGRLGALGGAWGRLGVLRGT